MKFRLIAGWKQKLHSLWSIRVSLALGVFTGIAGLLGALTDTLNPWLLIALGAVVNGFVIPVLRLVKQAPVKRSRKRAKA